MEKNKNIEEIAEYALIPVKSDISCRACEYYFKINSKFYYVPVIREYHCEKCDEWFDADDLQYKLLDPENPVA